MFLNKRYNVYALFLVGLFIYIISFLFDLQVLSRETALSDIDNQTLDTFYITLRLGETYLISTVNGLLPPLWNHIYF